MKGHKLLALLMALLLCIQLLPVSTAFAEEVSEDGISVTLKANSANYGTVTSSSSLTGLKKDDTVELTATPLKDSYVKFRQWAVYNSKGAKATLDTDYTLTETEPGSGKATLTVLGTTDLSVMAVFKGDVVGLASNYQPVPSAGRGPTAAKKMITLVSGTAIQGITVISGWDNNPKEPLTATITLDARPTDQATSSLRLEVWENVMAMGAQPKMLAEGAQYKFDNVTKMASESNAAMSRYSFGEGWDWTEYSFSIVDSKDNVLKPGKIIFKYPGIATIDAKNGSVKCGEATYTDGQTVNLGTGEKTIEAVPDTGYVFTGWKIDGVTPGDATANPLTFDLSLIHI